jgi:hypothetical protein
MLDVFGMECLSDRTSRDRGFVHSDQTGCTVSVFLVISNVRASACTEGLTEGALIGISVEVVPFSLPRFVSTHRADEGCSFSEAHVADRLSCSGLCIMCLMICG